MIREGRVKNLSDCKILMMKFVKNMQGKENFKKKIHNQIAGLSSSINWWNGMEES